MTRVIHLHNSCPKFHLWCLFSFFILLTCHKAGAYTIDLALYYGEKNLPLHQLKLYKNVVIQPQQGFDPKKFDSPTHKAFVYTSIGEVESRHFYPQPIHKKWILGRNQSWQTLVLDQSNPEWQNYFLEHIITRLWDEGYRGFYLDTLDSYRLITNDPLEIKKQQEGIVAIIKSIKKKYPHAELILNRGFEIIPEVYPLVSRMTVESVFSGWDNKKKQYFIVSSEEREAVLHEMQAVQKLGIPITIIDYVAPNHEKQVLEIANKISQLGYSPWITNSDLTKMYLFNEHIIPRKILVFYRGALNNVDERLGSVAVRTLLIPLNNLGYITEVHNVNESLPKNISKKEYAGIVMSIDGILLGKEEKLFKWYLKQIDKKIPVVILNDFGFILENEKLKYFGLSLPMITHRSHSLKITYQSPLIGFESQPILKTNAFNPIKLDAKVGESLLKVETDIGEQADIAAITSWGGYYMGASFLSKALSESYHWTINPFLFFKQALRLPEQPIPDTTTENGMRLMFTHVDGDGFANKGEWFNGPYVGEIMQKQIFERYNLPTTVSVIQGEIAANGIHSAISKELEARAKEIFLLPNVEIASHTFSHPYNWHKASLFKGKGYNPFTLPIPDYSFNVETEVVGSVNYINNTLAPPGKKCKVFLWSGEGDVSERALQLSYELGLRNINPGTIVTQSKSTQTNVSALGVNEGPYFQIFAPIGNDFEAQGYGEERFFYSLIKIIDALKITDKPHRVKPIDIYVHFFIMAQPGGVKALQAVYLWVLKQSIMPIYTSEYIDKVMDFSQLMIIKKDDGWLFETNDALRELRIPTSMGYPDLQNSKNVIGYNTYNDERYIHLGPGGEAFVRLTKEPSLLPYIEEANARVVQYVREKNAIHFTLEGYVPLKFKLANMKNCMASYRLLGSREPNKPLMSVSPSEYVFEKDTKAEIFIQCH